MFERFGAQAFFLANQGPLSLYSMGLTSGLCLNSGYSTTQAIPVYEGYSLPYCTRQLDIGGQQITDYLGRLLLSEKGQAFSSSSEKFLLSDMMQRNCYVPEGKHGGALESMLAFAKIGYPARTRFDRRAPPLNMLCPRHHHHHHHHHLRMICAHLTKLNVVRVII